MNYVPKKPIIVHNLKGTHNRKEKSTIRLCVSDSVLLNVSGLFWLQGDAFVAEGFFARACGRPCSVGDLRDRFWCE